MKKVMLIVISLMLTVSVIGCGKTGRSEVGEEKVAYEDEYVIDFADVGMEKYVRRVLGRLEGDIYYSDVKEIKRMYIGIASRMPVKVGGISYMEVGDRTPEELAELSEAEWLIFYPLVKEGYDYYNGWMDSEEITCVNSLEDLKYFTGLEYLYIESPDEEIIAYVTHVDFLENMQNLRYLYLCTSRVHSIDNIKNCKQLEEVIIYTLSLEDYSPLLELENLKKIYIGNGDVEQVRANVGDDVIVYEESF